MAIIDYGMIYCKGKNVNLNATQSYYEGGRTLGDLLDLVYPIGSIYMNVNDVNPQTLFGGTWEKISGRFLFGSDPAGGYPLGLTGGETKHTLSIDEMPNHTHRYNGFPYGNPVEWADPYRKLAYINNSSNPYPNQAGLDATGGSQPHNNMPPYLVVNIWKRTK